jgi:hypothetical protein
MTSILAFMMTSGRTTQACARRDDARVVRFRSQGQFHGSRFCGGQRYDGPRMLRPRMRGSNAAAGERGRPRAGGAERLCARDADAVFDQIRAVG